MRQMSHSTMSSHQNYNDKNFLQTRFLLTAGHLKGFGVEYSLYSNCQLSFTLEKAFFSPLDFLVTAQAIGFRGKWSTDSSSLQQKTSK